MKVNKMKKSIDITKEINDYINKKSKSLEITENALIKIMLDEYIRTHKE